MIDTLDIILQGLLVGGFYALFATGLSLMFGVMRLVNLAHGDVMVLAAFLAVPLMVQAGLPAAAAILLVVPLMAAIGYAVQRLVLNRTLGRGILPPLLVTFGLSIVIQNALLLVFSADSRKLPASALSTASLHLLPGLSIGYYPLGVFLVALAVIGGLQAFLYRTRLGTALRATSDDPVTVRLMGIDNRHIFGVATALAFAVAGLAGILMGGYGNFDPVAGPSRLLFGFEAVIIGGLGNLWGTLLGGVILGVAQAIGAAIDPGFQVLAGDIAFFAILLAAPRGFFPRMADPA
jgi:branched-chain amino acid transport system permease protein